MKNKSLFTTMIFLFSIFLISNQLNANHDEEILNINEEAKIKKAVEEQYIEGIKIRDFDLIRSICIPEAKLMSAGRDGKLHLTTLEKWSKKFDPNNPPFKQLEAYITKIDREGTAAQIKILFIIDSKRKVIDYLNMLKLNGKWRIVNIIDY